MKKSILLKINAMRNVVSGVGYGFFDGKAIGSNSKAFRLSDHLLHINALKEQNQQNRASPCFRIMIA